MATSTVKNVLLINEIDTHSNKKISRHFKSSLLVLCSIPLFIIILVSTAPSFDNKTYSFREWINPKKLKEFKQSFYHLLDHNNDNIVNITELSIGIQTQLDSSYIPTDELISFIPKQYSCIQSLDFINFADCIIFKARKGLISTNVVSFEQVLNSYFGDCQDNIPPKKQFIGKFCDELISKNPSLCNKYTSYCKLSCHSCNINQNKLIQNPQKISPNIDVSISVPINNVLFLSDIHIEPWYNVQYPGHGKVSRFDGANIDNMFECRNSQNITVKCALNGRTDAPFPLYESGLQFVSQLQYFSNYSNNNILIFCGDTQAHDFEIGVSSPLTDTMPKLLTKVINEMLKYFDSENIFYTPGNNDGQHNEIFCAGSDNKVNQEWANILIENNIVTNDLNRLYMINNITYNQIELFQQTGYYMKEINFKNIVNTNYYAIIVNTNFGLNNFRQKDLLMNDLEWIKHVKNGYCLLIGHHSTIVRFIEPVHQGIIKGIFSGHTNIYEPSNDNYFVVLPSITQSAPYVGVVTGALDTTDGYVKLTWHDFKEYLGPIGKIAKDYFWGYDGKPKNAYGE
eukprot:51169_1